MKRTFLAIFVSILSINIYADDLSQGALFGDRYRIIISSDIGGSDPDDFQSMIHFMMYSDLFDTEGIIASPWDTGRKEHILEVIDMYERDYPKLKQHAEFPTPDSMRSIAKQGEIDRAPYKGYRKPTEGSNWIIECAKRDDPRPLYVLVWGLLEDVAQALHDAPEIQEKIRVVYIGGPNKKWGANAFAYIEHNFPDLWMIENNSTYRGFWVGGEQDEDLSNKNFFETHIKGHGALGDYFGKFYSGSIKMGDTPTLLYLMKGNPDDPTGNSWGGSFQPTKYRPVFTFDGHTTSADQIEAFSIVEWTFKGPDIGAPMDERQIDVEMMGQTFDGFYNGNGNYVFRWCPKAVDEWSYTLKSKYEFLHEKSGKFTSVEEGTLFKPTNSIQHNHWWTDRFNPELKEQGHSGVKTINRWREEYLRDWQKRLDWLQ